MRFVGRDAGDAVTGDPMRFVGRDAGDAVTGNPLTPPSPAAAVGWEGTAAAGGGAG